MPGAHSKPWASVGASVPIAWYGILRENLDRIEDGKGPDKGPRWLNRWAIDLTAVLVLFQVTMATGALLGYVR